MSEPLNQRPAFEAILRDRGYLEEGEVMTDAILVAAVERFDDTTSYVRVYPDGQQAHHISMGLLATVEAYLTMTDG
jgi:IMP cyclohydrolase